MPKRRYAPVAPPVAAHRYQPRQPEEDNQSVLGLIIALVVAISVTLGFALGKIL